MEIIYLDHYKGVNDFEHLELIEPLKVVDEDDAGVDMRAAIEDSVTLEPQEDVVIPSGVKIHIGSEDIPFNLEDYFGLVGEIAPRSGLGFKHYLRLANTIGEIDANYMGEILIKVRNEGTTPLTISRGDRVCQIIFKLYKKNVQFNEVTEFTAQTNRGEKGFGASGVK